MNNMKGCCDTIPRLGRNGNAGCCGSNSDDVQSEAKPCPECGKPGWNVPYTAVHNLLKDEHRSKLASGNYHICINPVCHVVYYNALSGTAFDKDSVRVKVWLKDPGEDVPLCYCNKITRGELRDAWQKGARTYNEVVNLTRGAKSVCNCKYENPSGRCCSSVINEFLDELRENSNADNSKRTLVIEFIYLDLSVCNWCQDTESNLDEAISEVANILKATGVDVIVRKIHVESEEQARELGFVSSPTIRINGKDLQLDMQESLCESCSDLCGEDVDCRIWTYQGKEYTAPPKGMIIDAILREVYGNSSKSVETLNPSGEVPENLKRFFKAKRRKKDNEISKAVDSCCNPNSNDTGCS